MSRYRLFLAIVILAGLAYSGLCSMTLFGDLHRITAEDGLFHGTRDTQMIVMLQHLRTHLRMRFTEDGRPESVTLSGIFERRFKDNFGLSSEQYDCIVDVFDRSPIGDIPTAIGASFPPPVPGTRPPYMSRTLSSNKTRCCGRALRVRWKWATVYLKENCYPAWNVVKTCRFGCGTRYMFDRRVIPGVHNGGQCDWHTYNAWSDGELPPFIATKSGHAVFCTKFLDHVAIEQATTRAGFQTQADVHHRTAPQARGDGTSRLSGPVLLEGSTLWTLLKHRQCRGPFWHAPPRGQRIRADRPQEVPIVDARGNLSGANNWKGLLHELDRLLSDIQREGLYTRHECRLCCQRVEMDGQEANVRAAVCDGLTAVRRAKCAVYGCAGDLCGTRGARYCAFHEETRGHMCSITDPPCPRARETGSLVCAFHRRWEEYYLRWIRRGGWHATNAARATGSAQEPRLIRYLRSMLGTRHTFGSLVCTWSCGIMAGMSPLIEAEGDSEVAKALDDIWLDPVHRPTILFYDRACKRRTFLELHPDTTWAMTINIVDRFHYRQHREHDCAEFCSPNRTDIPLLWRNNGDNDPTFRWNSSRAESSNSILHGLGPCVSNMSSTMNSFILMTNMFTHNELLLREKLHLKEPRFRL